MAPARIAGLLVQQPGPSCGLLFKEYRVETYFRYPALHCQRERLLDVWLVLGSYPTGYVYGTAQSLHRSGRKRIGKPICKRGGRPDARA